MKIVDLSLYAYQLDLHRPIPILNHQIHTREGFILKVVTDDQKTAYADIAPLNHYHKESLESVLKQFEAIKPKLLNSFWSIKMLLGKNHLLYQVLSDRDFPSLFFAIESALLTFLMPQLNLTKTVAINAFLQGSDEEILQKKSHLKDFKSIKIKVGNRNALQTLTLIDKLMPHLDSKQKLRLDIQQKWSLNDTLFFCSHFPIKRCEYLEEPLQNPLEFLKLAHQTAHPIAFDESILTTSLDFLLSVPTKKALIIKPSLIGSLQRIYTLYSKARKYNLEFILTSCFESGLGHLTIGRLAHYLAIEEPIGLDTYYTLKSDVLLYPLDMNFGFLHLKDDDFLFSKLNPKMLKLIA